MDFLKPTSLSAPATVLGISGAGTVSSHLVGGISHDNLSGGVLISASELTAWGGFSAVAAAVESSIEFSRFGLSTSSENVGLNSGEFLRCPNRVPYIWTRDDTPDSVSVAGLREPDSISLGYSIVGCESLNVFLRFCHDLRSLGEHLEDAIVAGIEALIAQRRDWIRMAAHEGREVLNQALRLLAPDESFSEAEIDNAGDEGEITRAMRVSKRLMEREGWLMEACRSQELQREAKSIAGGFNRLAHRDKKFSSTDADEIRDLYKRAYQLLVQLL